MHVYPVTPGSACLNRGPLIGWVAAGTDGPASPDTKRMNTDSSYLVTGASTGIGRACVAALAGTGARVWATVRSDADAESLRDQHGQSVSVVRLDLTDPDSVLAAGERICAAGPLSGLVNNAGVALPGPLEYIPMDVFRRQIEVNLVGQLAVTQAALPALRKARERASKARIVMIGSIGGRIATPMLGPYHASKFGLVGLTDTLRAELAPSGIQVVLVEPGAHRDADLGPGRSGRRSAASTAQPGRPADLRRADRRGEGIGRTLGSPWLGPRRGSPDRACRLDSG